MISDDSFFKMKNEMIESVKRLSTNEQNELTDETILKYSQQDNDSSAVFPQYHSLTRVIMSARKTAFPSCIKWENCDTVTWQDMSPPDNWDDDNAVFSTVWHVDWSCQYLISKTYIRLQYLIFRYSIFSP